MTTLVAARTVHSDPDVTKTRLLVNVCAATEYFFELRRTTNPGGVDTQYHELHGLYVPVERSEPTAEKLAPVSPPHGGVDVPTARPDAALRFGLRGRHVFRFDGAIEVLGGTGEWAIRVMEGRGSCEPTVHRLPARIAAGSRYVVPSFASDIGACRSAVLFTDQDGTEVELTPTPVPLAAAMYHLSNATAKAVWIFSQWSG